MRGRADWIPIGRLGVASWGSPRGVDDDEPAELWHTKVTEGFG